MITVSNRLTPMHVMIDGEPHHKVKARKPALCKLTKKPIKVGDLVYRPMRNTKARWVRYLASEVEAIEDKSMKVTIEPTPELTDVTLNGRPVPCRVWRGQTDKGTPVEMFVLSIIPAGGISADPAVEAALKAELPDFIVPTRRLAAIGDNPKEET